MSLLITTTTTTDRPTGWMEEDGDCVRRAFAWPPPISKRLVADGERRARHQEARRRRRTEIASCLFFLWLLGGDDERRGCESFDAATTTSPIDETNRLGFLMPAICVDEGRREAEDVEVALV